MAHDLPDDQSGGTEYEAAKLRLVERVKGLVVPVNFTDQRDRMTDISERLAELVDELDGQSPGVFDLETEHDKPPEKGVGLDGLPIVWPDYRCSFKGTLGYMRDLAESARRVAASYPEPRRRPALPAAATGFVWLRREFGYPSPSLYDTGGDVREFGGICEAAGLHKAPETLRNALSVALREWENERHMQPGWVHYVITGRW